MSNITLMAIDPGYDRLGWAVGQISHQQIISLDYGLIQTSAKQSLLQRYQVIDQELSTILETHRPQECAIESLFFSKNKTTALKVAEARGVILSCLFRHQVTSIEYNPLEIKQGVTGYGKADKLAVEKMVKLQLKKFITTTSPKIIDDTLDALALLITHQASRKLKSI